MPVQFRCLWLNWVKHKLRCCSLHNKTTWSHSFTACFPGVSRVTWPNKTRCCMDRAVPNLDCYPPLEIHVHWKCPVWHLRRIHSSNLFLSLLCQKACICRSAVRQLLTRGIPAQMVSQPKATGTSRCRWWGKKQQALCASVREFEQKQRGYLPSFLPCYIPR